MPSSPQNILADTGPIVAIIRADGAHHARAKAFGQSYTGTLITTWPVIAEAAHLLGRQGRATLLEMILDGFLAVEDLSAADTDRMRTMLRRYETMDLGDASIVAIGERLGVLDVITIDRRDFAVYRTRTGRAFVNHFPKTP